MSQKQSPTTLGNCNITLSNKIESKASFLTLDRLLLFLLAIFIFIIYSSSLKGPFIFDDIPNILDNPQIRLTHLTLDEIISSGFQSPASNRPTANISFALNYYFNRYDVAGYHLVNILIHILTGILLFYFIKVTLELLNLDSLKLPLETNAQSDGSLLIHKSINSNILTTPRPHGQTSSEVLFIAFFTTFIWLVHPIQTQTVSYIVQRMNCMSAMFYIFSLLLYVKARLANRKKKKQVLFLGCILSGLLSLTSKEIATTLPFFIFIYEWYFFQEVSLKWLKRNSIYLLGFLFIVILLAFVYLNGHPIEKILSTYNHRNFTLWERVLTELRVIFYYISLIIFPHPTRLNLLHDFTISHSFLDPITTLFSFVAIAGLMLTSIWLAKRERLLSFSILWFLGNLIIESSIIGLEIIFEHRNYLPSMFFILMFVVSVRRFINSKLIGGALLCVVVMILSVWTYQRNLDWNDDLRLWKDVVKKSPNTARSHNNLGDTLRRRGYKIEAMEHLSRALQIDPEYAEAHNNVGVLMADNGEFDKAIEHYLQALHLRSDFASPRYNMGVALIQKGKYDEAKKQFLSAIQINPYYANAHNNLGNIFLIKGDIEKAIFSYRKALQINPKHEFARKNLMSAVAKLKANK